MIEDNYAFTFSGVVDNHEHIAILEESLLLGAKQFILDIHEIPSSVKSFDCLVDSDPQAENGLRQIIAVHYNDSYYFYKYNSNVEVIHFLKSSEYRVSLSIERHNQDSLTT